MLIKGALTRIAKLYNNAFRSLINKIPEILEENYNNKNGFKDAQKYINDQLKNINEFQQIKIQNGFFEMFYNEAVRSTKTAYGLKYNFSQVDTRAIQTLQAPQNWFTAKYQTLVDQEQSLKKMQELWETGKPVKEAVKELEKVLKNTNKRIMAYNQTAIITNSTRIKTTADLNVFQENDIENYIYTAVIDNVTTETCRELDKQTYSTRKALDFQNKIDEDVNSIIQEGQKDKKEDWQIYNKAITYLQKNDALANQTGTDKRPWQSKTILRTKDTSKQGKRTVKSYKNLASVPGNNLPRPPLHYNCRSRIEPQF